MTPKKRSKPKKDRNGFILSLYIILTIIINDDFDRNPTKTSYLIY